MRLERKTVEEIVMGKLSKHYPAITLSTHFRDDLRFNFQGKMVIYSIFRNYVQTSVSKMLIKSMKTVQDLIDVLYECQVEPNKKDDYEPLCIE